MIWALAVSFLKEVWAKFFGWIIAAGVIVSVAFTILLKGRADGRRQYREAHQRANKKAAERTAKIVNKIEGKGDAEIKRRLSKYYRD